MSRKIVKLGSCCVKIGSGATPKGGATVYIASGTSFIRSQNVYNLAFDYEGLTHITEDAAKKLNGVAVHEKDVLLNITGDSVARVCMVPNNVLPARVNQHVAIIRTKENLLPEYLLYYLASPHMQAYMLNLAVGKGASRNALTKGMIEDFPLLLPTIEEQKIIVKNLSSYDNLIKNNQKQIELLEEAAQRLYKEWFVDLRFPGHESTPIVNGVPQGWNKERLVDIADVQYGYAFDGSLFNSEGSGMPIIRIRNIPDGITKDYTTEEASEQYIVKNGDIIVGMDGEFHINSWCGTNSYLVQRTCCIKPKNSDMKGYILQAIYEPIKFFESTVVGATVAHLGKKHIDTITILSAPKKLYKPFQLYFNKRQLLLNQNQKLSEARDRLLQKLVCGEIEV